MLEHDGSFCLDLVDMGEEPTCTISEYLLVDRINEEKEKTVETIANLLPFEVTVSDDEDTSVQVYEKLAEIFSQDISPEGHDEFIAATDEINGAYVEECSRADSSNRDDIADLKAKFNDLTHILNGLTPEKLTEARSLYGKALCYYEEDKEDIERVKRLADIYDFSTAFSPSVCDCPEVVSDPCEFFACITIPEVRFIMGFGQVLNSQHDPCIGFALDTTGSMKNETEAAKRVIRTFLRSQADATICYVLVPFNDYGVGHGEYSVYHYFQCPETTIAFLWM